MRAVDAMADGRLELAKNDIGLVLKDVKALARVIGEGRLQQCLEREPEETAAFFCARAEALLEEALEALS